MSQKDWDKYYFDICNAVAKNSKCLSRKIGSIVVMDKSIISTGYNGPPRGVPPCSERWTKDEYLRKCYKLDSAPPLTEEDLQLMIRDRKDLVEEMCPRRIIGYGSGKGLDLCVAGHSERNSLINAARHGIAIKGAIMYMNCAVPCSPCLIEIINAGISEVVCTRISYYDGTAKYLVDNSGIKLRTYDFEM